MEEPIYKPVQTRQGDTYSLKCHRCGARVVFGAQVDGIDPDGIIIGWDGKVKQRPVSFCSQKATW